MLATPVGLSGGLLTPTAAGNGRRRFCAQCVERVDSFAQVPPCTYIRHRLGSVGTHLANFVMDSDRFTSETKSST